MEGTLEDLFCIWNLPVASVLEISALIMPILLVACLCMGMDVVIGLSDKDILKPDSSTESSISCSGYGD